MAGVRGNCPFEKMISHFSSLGGDVIVLNPTYVYGEKHVLSAVSHAERAFKNGTQRSKNLITEIIMYVSGERQAYKAQKKMKPAEGSDSFVLVMLDIKEPKLSEIGLEEDASVLKGSPEKAAAMGLDNRGLNVSYEQLALELVAMLDTEKI